ncbi:MAG: alpha/beta hydrolase, partial [Alphaproteobacteria bacterium]|nr:alpha/beta hydrolase [Alphaproteobacteria bacterium]
SDVDHIITIAGNMDHAMWTKHHDISPLSASLNPADHIREAGHFQQTHFVGAADDIIPDFILRDFSNRQPNQDKVTIKTIKSFDHQCCWVEEWDALSVKLGL